MHFKRNTKFRNRLYIFINISYFGFLKKYVHKTAVDFTNPYFGSNAWIKVNERTLIKRNSQHEGFHLKNQNKGSIVCSLGDPDYMGNNWLAWLLKHLPQMNSPASLIKNWKYIKRRKLHKKSRNKHLICKKLCSIEILITAWYLNSFHWRIN